MKKPRRGVKLEKMLDAMHLIYRNRGFADIGKKEIKTLMGNDGNMKYVKKEGFDYEGCVKGGLSIAIEAKEGQERLSIIADGKKGSGIKMHQLRALLFRGELGGLSGIIWMPTQREVFLLNHRALKKFHDEVYNKKVKGRPVKSISQDFAREHGRQVMNGGLIDYLGSMQS